MVVHGFGDKVQPRKGSAAASLSKWETSDVIHKKMTHSILTYKSTKPAALRMARLKKRSRNSTCLFHSVRFYSNDLNAEN
jgi:hypothetical protein